MIIIVKSEKYPYRKTILKTNMNYKQANGQLNDK